MSEPKTAEVKVEDAIVRDIAEQLGASIAGLGFPVGMGTAPPEEMCLRAARGIVALYGRQLSSTAPASPPAETGEGVGVGLVKVTIFCPNCSVPHVDEGEWTTRPHKTHQCQSCGEEWRPFPFSTVGIAHPASDQSDTERMRATDERSAFEVWYCADAAQHGLTFMPAELLEMREGDGYGEHRVALNSKWEGWQACAALAEKAADQ